ncbi:translation initiation factor IF-2 N-terminal domain-containing protein [Nocardia sp. NPDC004068]|uniref:translation initiation factor IF-2 N-terminal domain-containing protein n=1 Tax=Nocardia sp. NPDC004068 TaxID=3364303 RepID=UPI0036A5785F
MPERIRVHALAKLLGTTSKRILAHLTELGAEARSPQSSLDRTVAESVRDALGPADPAQTGAPQAESTQTETTPSESAAVPPPASPEPPAAEDPGSPSARAESAQAQVEEARPDNAQAESAQPENAQSEKAQPEKAQPESTQPEKARAESAQPEKARAESAQPEKARAESAQPEKARAENAQPEKAQAESTQPEGTQAENAQAESTRARTAQPAFAQARPESAPERAEQTEPPARSAQPEFTRSAPQPEAESRPAAGQSESSRTSSLFTSPFHAPAAPPEPVVFEPPAVVAAPLFLPPDATRAEEIRRRLRAEREAKVEDDTPRAEEQAPEARTPERKQDKPAEPAAEDTDSDSDWDDDQEHGSDERGDEGNRSRRRRRGRRGRGRGRGEQHSDADDNDSDDTDEQGTAEDSSDSDNESAEQRSESDDSDDGDDSSLPDGSTRRRRRRRRRKAGEDGDTDSSSDDDPPNTVVHEREPRNKRRAVDEVQGITGSTRLEAKRQRRRDGREAGRRRPPILTESEFLARREAVDRVMVVREKTFPEHPSATIQVAVLEDNILVEHFVTSTGQASMVGNVYLGKVQNVLPSMEAAFVDIGRGRNGVLYAGEVNWEAAGLGGKERKIEQALKPGDTVLVQVSKDPVGHKGARLTTQISLAGRFLVYVPGGTSTGISRKLPDTERKRLKEILRDIVPQDAGVIIRTASEGVSETELARDVERLQATWKTIEDQSKNGSNAPKTLYEEPDLLVKVIRDLFNEDFSKLVIEGERAWTTVENYIRTVAPDLLTRIERYDGGNVDVFGSFRIDEQLAKALDRKVWLPSGGTLVIDRTEAMTVIDVNTGKFTGAGGSNLEETVTRNNLEAAEEIVRQLRLRDIGGMIVVDFIDMVLESNRDLVLRRLTECLGRDRTRHQVSEVTSLGLVQMTRKKLGTGLVEAFSTTCEHCHGRGIVVHNYPVETAPAEEGAGRREGRRRRKEKEKEKAVVAPAAPAPQPVPELTEEEAAAKRAHPVALAMAAHQAEEAAAAAAAESEVAAVAAEAVADAVAEQLAGDVEVVSEGGAAHEDSAAEQIRPTGRGGRAARAARRALRRESRAEAVAVENASRTTDSEGRDETVAASSDSASEPTGRVAPEAEPSRSERESRSAAVESGHVDSAPGSARREPAVNGVAESAGGHRDAEQTVAAAVAEARAATHVATQDPHETPASGERAADTARRGRRRVARTAAAPSADSSGAVFVLGSDDREQGPSFSLDELAPAEVTPRQRPRRRSAGRAAGAPEQSD